MASAFAGSIPDSRSAFSRSPSQARVRCLKHFLVELSVRSRCNLQFWNLFSQFALEIDGLLLIQRKPTRPLPRPQADNHAGYAVGDTVAVDVLPERRGRGLH
jgi:hypothetical protein